MALSHNTTKALIHELKEARAELRTLRAVDAVVQAFALALNAEPPRHGMGEDVVWRAEKELRDSEPPPAATHVSQIGSDVIRAWLDANPWFRAVVAAEEVARQDQKAAASDAAEG